MIKEYDEYINEGIFSKKLKVGDYVIYNPPTDVGTYIIYKLRGETGKIIPTPVSLAGVGKIRVKFNKSIKIDITGKKKNCWDISTKHLIKTTNENDIKNYEVDSSLYRIGIL